MTTFIKIENDMPVGYPIVHDNMKYLFPNFNFDRIITPDMVKELGFGIFEFTQRPEIVERYKTHQEGTPFLGSNGIYYQTWEIVDLTDQEKQIVDERQAEKVKFDRNNLLRSTDFTQLPDSPLSTEQKEAYRVYRQQLRDITSQAGFPWDIDWPIEPSE